MIDLKSWNPWHGCRKYSEGCANCYMFVLDKAHKVPGQSTEIFRTKNFAKPMERDRKGNFKVPPGYWVRVNMTSDTFLEEADPWRDAMWRIMKSRGIYPDPAHEDWESYLRVLDILLRADRDFIWERAPSTSAGPYSGTFPPGTRA